MFSYFGVTMHKIARTLALADSVSKNHATVHTVPLVTLP